MSIGCLHKGIFYTNSDLAYQSAPVFHSHFHQVENEYGAFGYGDFPRDLKYLNHVKEQLLQNGVVELLFTSDSPRYSEDMGALPGGRSNAKLVPRNADVSSWLLARTHEHAYVLDFEHVLGCEWIFIGTRYHLLSVFKEVVCNSFQTHLIAEASRTRVYLRQYLYFVVFGASHAFWHWNSTLDWSRLVIFSFSPTFGSLRESCKAWPDRMLITIH